MPTLDPLVVESLGDAQSLLRILPDEPFSEVAGRLGDARLLARPELHLLVEDLVQDLRIVLMVEWKSSG